MIKMLQGNYPIGDYQDAYWETGLFYECGKLSSEEHRTSETMLTE